jgi:hypothetical protein
MATGLKVNFISADDLIASKLASGRARDLADVEDIRKAAESQQPRPAKNKPTEPTQSGGIEALTREHRIREIKNGQRRLADDPVLLVWRQAEAEFHAQRQE